jgi:hypothetical protein
VGGDDVPFEQRQRRLWPGRLAGALGEAEQQADELTTPASESPVCSRRVSGAEKMTLNPAPRSAT